MKTIFNLLLFLSIVSFKSKDTIPQSSSITNEVIYDSYNIDDGFSFLYIDENEFEEVLIFNKIPTELLEKYDLQSDEFFGVEFTITYEKETSKKGRITLTLLTINLLE